MTISIWRYSHLALAISSFVFIFLASVTGIILAFEPISEKMQPYKADGFNQITLAESLSAFTSQYPEVISLEVDSNDFVLASVFTEDGESLYGYFNPKTGVYLGEKIEPSKFFQWTTNFHRSLFLKTTGRFLVGLCSFLLFLIAVSGSILILKRQRSVKKLFSKIVNDNFAQYWHVVLGRVTLIPILIITLTGVYLSLEKFNLLPTEAQKHTIDYEALQTSPQQEFSNMTIFKNTKLSDVKALEFPFSNDAEDYYTLQLKDSEMVVNQFSGEILSEIEYPVVDVISDLSLNLHTGKGSILWSLILAIASLNILFFIYSGFLMTIKRRAAKLKNKFKKKEARFVILVGSENGGTLAFANALQEQLIAAGETVYIAELNAYGKYKKMEHLVVMTSTYGNGDAPTNATRFLDKLKTVRQHQNFTFSVVGFGSLAYPDFCKFAFDVDTAFLEKNIAQLVPPFTINDKSFESFEQWVHLWTSKVAVPITIPQEHLVSRPKQTKAFEVVAKTDIKDNPDNTFTITLKPKHTLHFTSGDLLAVYPNDDYRERLYSIGKITNNIQLSVKYYDNGLGSNYLNKVKIGGTLKARLIENAHFHLPKKAPKIIMIANGTGIAPFLGMLDQNKKHIQTEAYFGLRREASYKLYKNQIEGFLKDKKLSRLNLAYSQQDEHIYVQHLLKLDGKHIAKSLADKSIIMICGSLAMYQEVMETLDAISLEFNNHPISTYAAHIKSDCY